jgi:hypothetical protein
MSLEALEGEAQEHINHVQKLNHLGFPMRELEVARTYTMLQTVAILRGRKDKALDYEGRAVEALRRSGASVSGGQPLDR